MLSNRFNTHWLDRVVEEKGYVSYNSFSKSQSCACCTDSVDRKSTVKIFSFVIFGWASSVFYMHFYRKELNSLLCCSWRTRLGLFLLCSWFDKLLYHRTQKLCPCRVPLPTVAVNKRCKDGHIDTARPPGTFDGDSWSATQEGGTGARPLLK